MKHLALFAIITVIATLSAYQKDIYGSGERSGTFHYIASNKVEELKSNGTSQTNTDMCGFSNQFDGTNEVGISDTATQTFSPDNCVIIAPLPYRYSLDGNHLTMTHRCISTEF